MLQFALLLVNKTNFDVPKLVLQESLYIDIFEYNYSGDICVNTYTMDEFQRMAYFLQFFEGERNCRNDSLKRQNLGGGSNDNSNPAKIKVKGSGFIERNKCPA